MFAERRSKTSGKTASCGHAHAEVRLGSTSVWMELLIELHMRARGQMQTCYTDLPGHSSHPQFCCFESLPSAPTQTPTAPPTSPPRSIMARSCMATWVLLFVVRKHFLCRTRSPCSSPRSSTCGHAQAAHSCRQCYQWILQPAGIMSSS